MFRLQPQETPSILLSFKVKVTSVSLGVQPHLRLMTKCLLLFDSYGLVFVGRPL
jgi:hypothetical protein